jgi:hypothetical protein
MHDGVNRGISFSSDRDKIFKGPDEDAYQQNPCGLVCDVALRVLLDLPAPLPVLHLYLQRRHLHNPHIL